MKKPILLLIFLSVIAGNMNGQLVGVTVDNLGALGAGLYPAGYHTYRVYAELQDPGDFVASVYAVDGTLGQPVHTATVGKWPGDECGVPIWNSAFAGITGPDVNPAFCGIFPEACYDSFVTIGRANNASPGNAINVVSNPAGQIDSAFGSSNTSNTFAEPMELTSGSWSALPGDVNGLAQGPLNRVLLLQVTCPQDSLTFALNIEVYNAGDPNNPLYYCHNLEGGPGIYNGVQEIDGSSFGLVYPEMSLCPGCLDPIACNYNPMNDNSDNCFYSENCDGDMGCMNPLACNYEPLAVFPLSSTCTFPGCTDVVACNYHSLAGCDDGSCNYPQGLFGIVYFDVDGDSVFDNSFGATEPTMGNIELLIMPDNVTIFTNAGGEFVAANLSDGEHTVTVIESNILWEITTEELTFVTPVCEPLYLGVASSEYSFAAAAPCWIWSMNIHCTNGFNPGVWVNNTGSVPLTGTFTLTCDPLFTYSAMTGNSVVQPDVINPGEVIWNIDEQAPFSSWLYGIHVNGPGAEYAGDVFPFDLHLVLVDDQGNEFYNNTWTLNPTVVCSYDPNDKYTAEPGYTEVNHFVLQEDEIEYRVRFQNTGNLAAERVVIRDTLDLDFLDLESFYPVFASHDFMTCVEPNGALTFTFDNIMLPDSTTDEPGSQGYVVYRVRPRAEVEHMDVIENTAYIFFDDNPAVVTNTTWHTIMDCNSLTGIVGEEIFCEGDVGYFSAEQPYVENYNWTVEGESSGAESSLIHPMDEQGVFDLGVEISNPLCTLSDVLSITVHPMPETTIAENGAELTAPDGSAWQWYFEGSEIEGATDQNYTATTDGYYQVFVTNEFGCTVFSEEVLFVGLNEQASEELLLFPNPMSERASLVMPQNISGCEVELRSAEGKLIRTWTDLQSHILYIERHELSNGVYFLQVKQGPEMVFTKKLIVR